MSQETLPSFSSEARSIIVGGCYEHYKGDYYEVLCIARHSETLEELVVYQALYGERDVWIRPIDLFFENVVVQEELRPRFELVQ